MHTITCISYHGTGSGAVDDFFKEFDNIASGPSEIESRFLQDPDGVSDLEYQLIENPQRLNSGFAVKRYENYCKLLNRTYSYVFGKKWMEYSNDYISSLIDFKYPGYWHGDLWLEPKSKYYFYKFRRLISKISPKAISKPNYYNYFPNIETYHVNISESEFLNKTKKYTDNLCKALNSNGKEFVLLDQAVPTMNIKRYIRYFDDLKVIIVDRDPRDTYVNHQKGKDHVLAADVKQFCKTFGDYRRTLNEEIKDTDHVLLIQFEDLIFHYDETTKKINDFIGIDPRHHINKYKYFDPKISINNTQQWLKIDGYLEAARIISGELPEFLYDFDNLENENNV